jgi:hypothetical protein
MTIILPALCGVRSSAQKLVSSNRDKSPIIDARAVKSMAQGYADELCKQLVEQKVDRVTLIQPNDNFTRYFNKSRMLRNAKFLLECE